MFLRFLAIEICKILLITLQALDLLMRYTLYLNLWPIWNLSAIIDLENELWEVRPWWRSEISGKTASQGRWLKLSQTKVDYFFRQGENSASTAKGGSAEFYEFKVLANHNLKYMPIIISSVLFHSKHWLVPLLKKDASPLTMTCSSLPLRPPLQQPHFY